MVLLVIFAALAAFGLWCCVFCVAGWFLSWDDRLLVICLLPEDRFPDGAISRFLWLKGLGLVRPPLLIIGDDVPPDDPDIEYCSLQELPARLELERKNLD